jgi:hypothetical protein
MRQRLRWVLDIDIEKYFGAPGDRQEADGESPLQ